MSTVTELRKWGSLGSVKSTGTIAMSGSYATGGEVLAIPKPGTTKNAYYVDVMGISGFVYMYDVVAGKLKVFTGAAAQAALTELAAGAYPAGVTGDTVRYEAEWPKLG